VEKKEKVNDFNQCFTTILKKFPADVALVEALTVEHYTSTLYPSIGMFFK
jgi:hypothetical protein